MKKSEMNAQQLAERAATIRTLVAAGWTETSQGDWFDRDLWGHQEATLEYDNGKMILRIGFSAERRSLDLRVETYMGHEIALSISYNDRLKDVLDAIIRVQDTITSKNYKEITQRLVRDCPEIHVLAGADESTWVRLVDDEGESPHQLRTKEQFVRRLSLAGWSVKSHGLDPLQGTHRSVEATAEFRNAFLTLRLSYFRDGWLQLRFMGSESSELLPLRLKWKHGPETLLDALVEMQNTFSSVNYPNCLKKLIAVSELVLLETNSGLVKLSL